MRAVSAMKPGAYERLGFGAARIRELATGDRVTWRYTTGFTILEKALSFLGDNE